MFLAVMKKGVGNLSLKQIVENGEAYMDAAYFAKSKNTLRRTLIQQGLNIDDYYVFELKFKREVAIEQ